MDAVQLEGDPFQLALHLSVIVGLGLLASFAVQQLMSFLNRQKWLKNHLWGHALVTVFSKPAIWAIWVIAIMIGLDVVQEYYLIEGGDHITRQINEISATILLVWLIFRWKNQVEVLLVKPVKAKKRKSIDKATIDAIGRLVSIFLLLLTALTILQILEVPISTFLAVGGIGAAAAAYSSADIVRNFFGGLMINLMRPFAVGDWINSPDKSIEGTVEDIGWYQTTIRTFDKRPIYVPNGLFPNMVVCNPTRMSHRRIREDVGVRYDDMAAVRAIVEDIEKMVAAHPEIATDVAQMVHMTHFADCSVVINIYCFTVTTNWKEWRRIQQDVLLKVADIIDSHGAQIAFPTRVLKLETEEPIMMKS